MNIKTFLRYGCRHTLFFPGDGKLPQIDPTSSYSHTASGKRTRSITEPLWMFRVRQNMFCDGGAHRCPQRGAGLPDEEPDLWEVRPNGDRCCSFCGSLHPDDFLRLCRAAVSGDDVEIDPTSKSYKCYVRQPDVTNAAEGGIKFYHWHARRPVTAEDNDTYAAAISASDARYRLRMEKLRAEWSKK